jgi:hypothetical protein
MQSPRPVQLSLGCGWPEGRISFALEKNNLFADADAVGHQGLGATWTQARKPQSSQIRNIFSNYREKLASRE